tara:strand:- start:457 stop:729 length:273 start_codon:yes stop_codon:yes gene_type:complete
MNSQLVLQAVFTCEVDAVSMGHGVVAAKELGEKPHADPQLLSSIRDNCKAWCPCPRHVVCCGAIGIPPRFLLVNNLQMKFFQQTAAFYSI